MQIAREKEKIDINDQRQRLKDEQRRQAAMDQRYGVGGTRDSRDSTGILSFIRSLFD
jgi:hypothetical protein